MNTAKFGGFGSRKKSVCVCRWFRSLAASVQCHIVCVSVRVYRAVCGLQLCLCGLPCAVCCDVYQRAKSTHEPYLNFSGTSSWEVRNTSFCESKPIKTLFSSKTRLQRDHPKSLCNPTPPREKVYARGLFDLHSHYADFRQFFNGTKNKKKHETMEKRKIEEKIGK